VNENSIIALSNLKTLFPSDNTSNQDQKCEIQQEIISMKRSIKTPVICLRLETNLLRILFSIDQSFPTP